ncbi:MAG: prepilin-type N-terminal cleavage/methylation domain-containing protein [Bdellovibrionales bacterium]|nr:prepilin-type N-terminal cleavage/methylation domain-containing protein [Bdellovibrionales bacterium]
MSFNTRQDQGFSLIEVLAAFMILAISIIVFMENQSLALRLVARIDKQSKAVTLAKIKMAQTNALIENKGISVIKEKESGEFEGEDNQDYSWTVYRRNVPAPDFVSLMSSFMGGEEDSDQSQQLNQAAQGPMKAITDIWGKALREIEIEVNWKEGETDRSVTLFSHYVDDAALGQVDGFIGALGSQLQGLDQGGGENE